MFCYRQSSCYMLYTHWTEEWLRHWVPSEQWMIQELQKITGLIAVFVKISHFRMMMFIRQLTYLCLLIFEKAFICFGPSLVLLSWQISICERVSSTFVILPTISKMQNISFILFYVVSFFCYSYPKDTWHSLWIRTLYNSLQDKSTQPNNVMSWIWEVLQYLAISGIGREAFLAARRALYLLVVV